MTPEQEKMWERLKTDPLPEGPYLSFEACDVEGSWIEITVTKPDPITDEIKTYTSRYRDVT